MSIVTADDLSIVEDLLIAQLNKELSRNRVSRNLTEQISRRFPGHSGRDFKKIQDFTRATDTEAKATRAMRTDEPSTAVNTSPEDPATVTSPKTVIANAAVAKIK